MSIFAAGHSAVSLRASRRDFPAIRRSRASGSITSSLSSPPMMISGSEPVASTQQPPQISAINLLMERTRDARDQALFLDFLFVDFRAGFVDHDHASTRVAVIKVNGDLTGDQVGGFLGVVLVLAIQSNRIFEPDTVSDVEMKNGHWPPP